MDKTNNNPIPFKTTEQAGAYLHVKPRTLERWRYEGNGPAYISLPGRVLYSMTDLTRWLDSTEVQPHGYTRTLDEPELIEGEPKLLTVKDLAAWLPFTVEQLNRARKRRTGPPHFRIQPGNYKYREDRVTAWLDSLVISTNEPVA